MIIITLTPCCGGPVYQFGADPVPSCTNYQVTIATDSPAGQITYTDCEDDESQVIDYPAVIPPVTGPLVFNFCARTGTVVTTGTLVALTDCSPEPLPDWIVLGALPNVIKWTIDGVTECYALTSEDTAIIPPELIAPPLSVDVEVLAFTACKDAAVDPDCNCDDPCYVLTDCEGIAEPIYTADDLSNVVGTVISLADDTNHESEGCWLVSLNPLPCDVVETVTIYKCYEDCEDCLPKAPPIRTPNPREVTPEFTTGLCDPKIVEKAFCEYGEMQYKLMMQRRYKIEDCCPKDYDLIAIRFSKIQMLLCESTDPTPDECNP